MILSLVALSLVPGTVDFQYDAQHLNGIFVNGASLLGQDVRTTGGYLIGSADGSDAQGHSVISIGGTDGRMKSDDPSHISPPPFKLVFIRKNANTLSFSVNVGPVLQDFETISMPFDFGLKSMESFSFDGEGYTLFCSENDGPHEGSGGPYSAIKPRCEVRDVSQRLIGKVGGASTETPSAWGQVDGPYATVRISVKSSHHYEKLVFMNHPGTHNVEFAFGKMNKGETASLSGEIEVTAKSGPDSWTFDAARELNHQIGREEGDAWSVKVGDPRESYMCFGPYATELGSGPRVAVFRVMLDNVSFDDAKILTLDVTDAKAGTVLAKMDLTRHSFRAPMEYQDFALPFQCPANAKIELRTLWHGASYARESQVVVRKR